MRALPASGRVAMTLLLLPALLFTGGRADWRDGPSVTAGAGRGTVGETVHVNGSGYRLCSEHCLEPDEVELFWDGVRIGDRVSLDADGAFNTSITVPKSTYVGDHEVLARGVLYSDEARTVFTTFTTLAISVSPAVGQPGDTITVRGEGYDTCPYFGNGYVQINWDGYSPPLAKPVIRGDGTFRVDLRVPEGADQRAHSVVGACADSGEYATTWFAVQEAAVVPSTAPRTSPAPTARTPDRPRSSPSRESAVPPSSRPPTQRPPAAESPAGAARPAPAPARPTPPVPPADPDQAPAAASEVPAEPTERGWPRPEVIDAIRMIGDPGLPLATAPLLLIVLALLAWLLIGWPAELFNRTFERNQHVIRRWLRLEQARRWLAWAGRHRLPSRVAAALHGQSWPVVVLFGVATAFVISFAEPGNVLGAKSIAVALSLLIAVPLVAVSYEFAIESYERLGTGGTAGRLRIVYPALALAVLCALVSRSLGFVPGYAYGLIIAYTIVAARPEDPRRNAVAVLRASGLLFGMALAAWSLRQFGTAAVTVGDDTPLGLRVVDTTLGLVTIMALETLVIGLMPIRFLHGHKLWAWNRYAWLAVYVAGAALFAVVLSGPSKSGDGDILGVLWLFAGFCAGSFAFWAVFAIRDVRHRRRLVRV